MTPMICPGCSKIIGRKNVVCPKCGYSFEKSIKIPRELPPEERPEMFECFKCQRKIPIGIAQCPFCRYSYGIAMRRGNIENPKAQTGFFDFFSRRKQNYEEIRVSEDNNTKDDEKGNNYLNSIKSTTNSSIEHSSNKNDNKYNDEIPKCTQTNHEQETEKRGIRRTNVVNRSLFENKRISNQYSFVDRMSGYEFEEYCVKLLAIAGYYNIQQTKLSGDYGIDIIAERNNVKIGIQCKRYSNLVGVKAVQEAVSGSLYYGCDVPMVLSNQDFTQQAIEMAQKTNTLLVKIEDLWKNATGPEEAKYNEQVAIPKISDNIVREIANEISWTFISFGIEVSLYHAYVAPDKIIYYLRPGQGVRVKTILSYQSEIELAIGMKVKMELIPEKSSIGVFVPVECVVIRSKKQEVTIAGNDSNVYGIDKENSEHAYSMNDALLSVSQERESTTPIDFIEKQINIPCLEIENRKIHTVSIELEDEQLDKKSLEPEREQIYVESIEFTNEKSSNGITVDVDEEVEDSNNNFVELHGVQKSKAEISKEYKFDGIGYIRDKRNRDIAIYKELKNYIPKLELCDIFAENGLIEIYFHQIQSKAFYIIREFAKCADELYVIQNELPEDSTVNYVAKFKKDRIEDIAFMQYCITKDSRMAGSAIYNIPVLEYWLGLECDAPPTFMRMYVSDEERIYYRDILQHIYSVCGEHVNYDVLPSKMPLKDKTSIMQTRAIDGFLGKTHPAYKDRIEQPEKAKIKKFDGYLLAEAYKKDNEKFYAMLERFKEKYNQIYQVLLDNGECSTKWKSEYELFLLIRDIYPNAVYQYRAKWLGYQSLDIFVPSERVAFEYQGEQHYRPIKVFGGEEHHRKQIELDDRKRKLCESQNVRLVEWKYDEPINKVNLKKKLKEYGLTNNV